VLPDIRVADDGCVGVLLTAEEAHELCGKCSCTRPIIF
jgi:hypothetical protein